MSMGIPLTDQLVMRGAIRASLVFGTGVYSACREAVEEVSKWTDDHEAWMTNETIKIEKEMGNGTDED